MIRVDDKECFLMARDLVRLEGLFVGGSAGAVVAGAVKYAKASGRRENILVLLPDSAQKYLSKIFNDNWMRENGFLEDAPGLGTVQDLLGSKSSNIVSAHPRMKVREVVSTLRALGISQLPVIDNGTLCGIVQEVDLLRYLASDHAQKDASIESLVEGDYATVSPDTKIELLQTVLTEAKLAIVLDGGTMVGIITKIDLIGFLADRTQAA
jgi:cystathionine beta-synthase